MKSIEKRPLLLSELLLKSENAIPVVLHAYNETAILLPEVALRPGRFSSPREKKLHLEAQLPIGWFIIGIMVRVIRFQSLFKLIGITG